jgi:1,2-diacylglycerol 3-alpha-glucosyltransferase
MKPNKIVFVQNSLGHYHYDRMIHLSDMCNKVGIALYNIELASYTNEYQWAVKYTQSEFTNFTLFSGQKINDIPDRVVWSALKTKLTELKPDVIFVIGYDSKIMRKTKIWAGRNGCATILVSDSNEFDRKRYWIFEFIKYLFVSRYDAALVAGTSSSLYIQKLGIPKERIVYGWDAIDNSKFSRRASDNRDKIQETRQKWSLPDNYFLFVGRLIKQKNLPRLLNAYKTYVLDTLDTIDPWPLVICGIGPEYEFLLKQIEGFPESVQKLILFSGHVKQPEIIDFYTCASCMVLPSVSETWGLVVNEALACSIPVIVSNQAGSSFDLVQNGRNGWLIDPYNIVEMTDILRKVRELDQNERINAGIRGRELIDAWGLEKFSNSVLNGIQIAYDHHNRYKT